MPKFRKRPVVVIAEQFFPERRPWPEGVVWSERENVTGLRADDDSGEPFVFLVETLEGCHVVEPGDWIIIGVNGERYPCKPDIFSKTYEELEVDDDA